MDIGNKPDSDQMEDHELEKLVRYEVDKALVSSAEGFAWSRALNVKLQRGGLNVGRLQNSSITPQTQKASLPTKFSPNPNAKPSQKDSKRSKRLQCLPKPKRGAGTEGEEVQFRQQLTNLRTLMPGGNEMGVNELLTEVGSYLVALELQVNVLRCLVDTQWFFFFGFYPKLINFHWDIFFVESNIIAQHIIIRSFSIVVICKYSWTFSFCGEKKREKRKICF